jgi:L-gulonate 3-dehydrogenase
MGGAGVWQTRSVAVMETRRVAVIGAGSLGVGWAAAFARAGATVSIYDTDPRRREDALEDLACRLQDLEGFDLLEERWSDILSRVSWFSSVDAAVEDAEYVQECAPEQLELKRSLFAQLDASCSPETILASSSSALTPSAIAAELPGRERCLVAHPANPPYLLPVVELVCAPFTAREVIDRAEALMQATGMSPVRVSVEVEGFVLNRLQGAVLREAYCLVRDGVATVDDVDRVMRDGLGRRWAIMGPFETSDLNTRGGIARHAEIMGAAYARMGAERGQDDPWTPDLVARVASERRSQLPLERWGERVAWRDRAMMILERARRTIEVFPED